MKCTMLVMVTSRRIQIISWKCDDNKIWVSFGAINICDTEYVYKTW